LRLHSRLYPTTTQFYALCSRACEAGVDPFPNDASLEFGEYTQHLKHRLAGGG
jgi:hypothetical protein